jgi:hypothetical protein
MPLEFFKGILPPDFLDYVAHGQQYGRQERQKATSAEWEKS